MEFIPARYFTKGRGGEAVRWIVVHDMEVREHATAAEAVARLWASESSPRTSAHLCVDPDSVVECVKPGDTAWCAPGANQRGYHIEHAGYARQTEAEWLDVDSKRILELSAKEAARLATMWGIPVRRLTGAQIKAGEKGFIGHVDVTNHVQRGNGHTDPGPNFPWDYYLARVRAYQNGAVKAPSAPAEAPKPAPKGTYTPVVVDGVLGPRTYRALQYRLGVPITAKFDPPTKRALQAYLKRKGLYRGKVDGIIGPLSVKALQRHLAVRVDGNWGAGTTRALQKRLNAKTF